MAAASVTAPWLLRRAFQALPFSQPLYAINKKLSLYGNLCSFPVQNPLRSSGFLMNSYIYLALVLSLILHLDLFWIGFVVISV